MSTTRPKGGWDIRRLTTHPGEVLREEFMLPPGLSANKLALALRVPVIRITEIIHERRGVSAETALRLAKYFGTSAEFWMNLQKDWELSSARLRTMKTIEHEVRPRSADSHDHACGR